MSFASDLFGFAEPLGVVRVTVKGQVDGAVTLLGGGDLQTPVVTFDCNLLHLTLRELDHRGLGALAFVCGTKNSSQAWCIIKLVKEL